MFLQRDSQNQFGRDDSTLSVCTAAQLGETIDFRAHSHFAPEATDSSIAHVLSSNRLSQEQCHPFSFFAGRVVSRWENTVLRIPSDRLSSTSERSPGRDENRYLYPNPSRSGTERKTKKVGVDHLRDQSEIFSSRINRVTQADSSLDFIRLPLHLYIRCLSLSPHSSLMLAMQYLYIRPNLFRNQATESFNASTHYLCD